MRKGRKKTGNSSHTENKAYGLSWGKGDLPSRAFGRLLKDQTDSPMLHNVGARRPAIRNFTLIPS